MRLASPNTAKHVYFLVVLLMFWFVNLSYVVCELLESVMYQVCFFLFNLNRFTSTPLNRVEKKNPYSTFKWQMSARGGKETCGRNQN